MVHRSTSVLGFRKEICEGHLGGVSTSQGKLLPSDHQGIFRIGNWSLYARILPSPVCCEILDPLGIVRLEGGGYKSEYELAFLEMARDMGYLTHLCFQAHQGRTDFKGETVLDHVMFWFSCADWQVKTCRSPFSLWDLAGRLFSPQLERRQNGNFSVTEWKSQGTKP